MSGFDLTKMMPIYLDEIDELVIALNDSLLKLETDPSDVQSLQEAFRYAHTIKGSSTLMGFADVKVLTHELESIFDQLRSKARTLAPDVLEIFFRCLDALRDYHLQVRANGTSQVDLLGLTALVVSHQKAASTSSPTSLKPAPTPELSKAAQLAPLGEAAEPMTLKVVFEPNLMLADVKARLILNRLGTRATILRSNPSSEAMETAETLPSFTVTLRSDASLDELKVLADVSGVTQIERVEDVEEALNLPNAEGAKPVEPLKSDAVKLDAIEAPTAPAPQARGKIAETVRVDIDRLDSLMNLAGELVINKARFLQVARGLALLFRESNAQTVAAEMEDRLESFGKTIENLAEGDSPTNGTVERCQVQFRGLRENFHSIQDELHKLKLGRERVNALSEAINQLTRVIDGIQKGVLDTRMVPIGPLFNRFRRVVRDLSLSSGKEVKLAIQGEKTELDKRMIDELGDPLIHMIRNSVDHGLETPEQRVAAGKPRVGTVSLSAAHRGNSVVILVSDDGRGIDTERIRKKIVANKVIHPDDAARLTDRELIPYIWHPGMSTAETITDVSGRGVGMDIVKSRVEGLNGGIEVRSVLGQGTTFIVRLPLTLAIMPSLLVRIYDEAYAIPLDNVDEILEVPVRSIRKLHGELAIETRNRVISLIELGAVFRWGTDSTRPREVCGENQTIVVIQNGETTIGLVVDELIGMQEVVLKSLEKNFQAVPGLSGASILGDGRVSLILDIDAVIGMAAHPHHAFQNGRRA